MRPRDDKEQIIAGIDPGTMVMGYGIIKVSKSTIQLLGAGVIKLNKLSTHYEKLKKIQERMHWLIEEYQPDVCVVESPFYGKNVQSMLKLGRAQGVVIAAAMTAGVPVVEYTPRKVKLAITGNGNASKEQVAAMLKTLLLLDKLPVHLDATDGLAVAVCHHFQGMPAGGSQNNRKAWAEFIRRNPDKAG